MSVCGGVRLVRARRRQASCRRRRLAASGDIMRVNAVVPVRHNAREESRKYSANRRMRRAYGKATRQQTSPRASRCGRWKRTGEVLFTKPMVSEGREINRKRAVRNPAPHNAIKMRVKTVRRTYAPMRRCACRRVAPSIHSHAVMSVVTTSCRHAWKRLSILPARV